VKGRELTLQKAIGSLETKNVSIDQKKKVIDISFARHLGNKSWGCIDFLKNYNGYRVFGFSKYKPFKDKNND